LEGGCREYGPIPARFITGGQLESGRRLSGVRESGWPYRIYADSIAPDHHGAIMSARRPHGNEPIGQTSFNPLNAASRYVPP
jgi:hypothetical protein